MSQLYGKALANQIPDSTTGNQARLAFGAMTAALAGAYAKLGEYDSTGLAEGLGLDAGSITTAHSYLDTTNIRLSEYYPKFAATDDLLPADLLTQLRMCVSTSSVAVQYIDENFGTSFLAELVDNVIAACATVTGKVANAISKVAGSFIGGTWWIWLLVAAGFVLVGKYKKATGGGAS
jgi:hypothetical protein